MIRLDVFIMSLATEIFNKNSLLKKDMCIEINGQSYTIKIVTFEKIGEILIICGVNFCFIHTYNILYKNTDNIMSFLEKIFYTKHDEYFSTVSFENTNSLNIFEKYFL